MKKLIILLLFFTFTSCYNNIKRVESKEPIEYTKDTMLVCIDNDTVYMFDTNNNLNYKIVNLPLKSLPIPPVTLAFICLCSIGLYELIKKMLK